MVMMKTTPPQQPQVHLYCPACKHFDLSSWLLTKGVKLQPVLAALLNEILHPENTPPRELRNLGVPESSFRFRLRKKGLPPPSRWIALANGIRAVRAIQADADRSLFGIAFQLGYADHSALSHGLRRTFGLTPSEVRYRPLSLQQLLDLWWERVPSAAKEQRKLSQRSAA